MVLKTAIAICNIQRRMMHKQQHWDARSKKSFLGVFVFLFSLLFD